MVKSLDKWQFGDFQTPDVLAEKVLEILRYQYKLSPQVILEPSCGKGAFVRASLRTFENANIIGLDINREYIEDANLSISGFPNLGNAKIYASDFFTTDWSALLSSLSGPVLIVGNPPWVTASELSLLNSQNLPEKSNFQNRRGIEAITGSGNFDISEWMLLQYVDWLSKREGTIAILCKYAIARKVLRQIHKPSKTRFSSDIYLIDAKAYFGAAVEACLFVLTTHPSSTGDCDVYQDLQAQNPIYSIGKRDSWMIRDISQYERWRHLAGQDLKYVWRSGVKHDCSKVMELSKVKSTCYENGLGEQYSLEEDCLYPLFKSSDIGNSRIDAVRKFVLITQRSPGAETASLQYLAPKTWQYLLEHDTYLSSRKSSIYKNNPPYSIFGIGPYSFKPWKIAISGLYKRLSFCLIGPLQGRAVMLDDTVNFLSFDTEAEAIFVFNLITAKPALEFLESMIFWDDKRPITIDILRRLSFQAVARELGMLEDYLKWGEVVQVAANGQLVLGLP